MPAATPPMYAHPSSSHGRRGIFAAKHLWVTPHSEEERWPAGMFPLQGPGEYSRGIVEWTQQVCCCCLTCCLSYCMQSSIVKVQYQAFEVPQACSHQ